MNLAPLSSKAVSGLFFRSYSAKKAKSYYERLCYRHPNSVQDVEIYRHPVDTGGMSEFKGELNLNDGELLGYQVKNVEYADAIQLDRRQVQFDQTGTSRLIIARKANRAAMHPDLLLAELINNGHQAASKCDDGSPFFSATHKVGKSGTQSNLITSPATTPSAPTPVEIANAINKGIATIHGYLDEAGYPTEQDAAAFVVMYPTGWNGNALAALSTNFLAAGSIAVSNPLNGLRNGAEEQPACKIIPILNPRLTDATKLFIFRIDDDEVRPFVFQERVPTTLEELLDGSSEAVLKNKWVMAIKANRGVGYMQWRHAVSVGMV